MIRKACAERFGIELFTMMLAQQELRKCQVKHDGLVRRQLRVLGEGGGRIRGGDAVEPALDNVGGSAVSREAGWVHESVRSANGWHTARGWVTSAKASTGWSFGLLVGFTARLL